MEFCSKQRNQRWLWLAINHDTGDILPYTFAEEKGYENTKFLFDDGYSETNFNRPAWKEIMELIETGQGETLIIKDMSRVRRDYLQIGMLMEHLSKLQCKIDCNQ